MRWMVLAAVLAVAAPVTAQTPQRDLAAQAAAMRKIDALAGRWLGQGVRMNPDGSSYAFTQTMINEPHANGLLLTLEGRSLRQGAAEAFQPGSGSFGVISFDEKTGEYTLRSFGFGEMVPARAELIGATTFRWTAAAGPAMLRFTIDLSKPGVWNELGERSGDGGKTWQATNRLIAYRVEAR
ncbi:MAG: hypothetical protein ACOYLS_06020 [Polymorphobacter sp.]